jgi:hypothetical protein
MRRAAFSVLGARSEGYCRATVKRQVEARIVDSGRMDTPLAEKRSAGDIGQRHEAPEAPTQFDAIHVTGRIRPARAAPAGRSANPRRVRARASAS